MPEGEAVNMGRTVQIGDLADAIMEGLEELSESRVHLIGGILNGV